MNFYEYLGVSQTANSTEIKKAFRKLAKQKHPDHNKDENAFWDMVELNIIRDTLLSEEKRRNYDLSLKNGTVEHFSPTPETGSKAKQTEKKSNLYRSVRSFFTYHCIVCGIELSSTWQGYCLLHYLEASGQIDNPDFEFEYAGQYYKWADPPDHPEEEHQNHTHHSAAIRVKPWQIALYTAFIIVISASLVIMAVQLLK